MGYIYYIKNLIDNKYYIGQTISDLKERWKQHRHKNSNCRYLKNAFNKYGFENFEFKMICVCFDKDLDRFEIDYIKRYNSLAPGGRMHKESKDKISKVLKELYANGYANPNIGRKTSEETKMKISTALTGRKLSKEHYAKFKKIHELSMKRVLQYDLDDNIVNIYKSGKEAAEKNNTTKAGVSMNCNGKRIQLKGFKYKYENEKVIEMLNELKLLGIQKKVNSPASCRSRYT